MRGVLNKLTDVTVRQAKPREKSYKLSDGGGLYIEVMPNGSKLWRLKYRLAGREKRFALGAYPTVSLVKARAEAHKARVLVSEGADPVHEARAQKRQQRNRFDALAEDWLAHNHPRWSDSTRRQHRLFLDNDILPFLGRRPISAITRPELVEVVQRVERRRAFEVACKVRQCLNQIFRFGLVKGIIQYNPATDLNAIAAQAPAKQHYPYVPLSEIPALLKAVEGTSSHGRLKVGVRLLLLIGVRPGELRCAPWSEFDLEQALWTIPAPRMKMRRDHVVPLSRQVLALLRALYAATGPTGLVLPGSGRTAPLEIGCFNNCLHRAGYKGRQTAHGFRHLLSTELNNRGYHRDWIERQLAHGDPDAIRATYNHALYLDQRRRMMQEWADEIDRVTGANVILGDFAGDSLETSAHAVRAVAVARE